VEASRLCAACCGAVQREGGPRVCATLANVITLAAFRGARATRETRDRCSVGARLCAAEASRREKPSRGRSGALCTVSGSPALPTAGVLAASRGACRAPSDSRTRGSWAPGGAVAPSYGSPRAPRHCVPPFACLCCSPHAPRATRRLRCLCAMTHDSSKTPLLAGGKDGAGYGAASLTCNSHRAPACSTTKQPCSQRAPTHLRVVPTTCGRAASPRTRCLPCVHAQWHTWKQGPSPPPLALSLRPLTLPPVAPPCRRGHVRRRSFLLRR